MKRQVIIDVSNSKKPYFDGVPVINNCYILSLTLRGHGYKEIGDQKITLQPGSIVCTPPKTLQRSFSSDGMEDIVIYTTRFDVGQQEGAKILCLNDDATCCARHLFEVAHNTFQQRNIFLQEFLDKIFDVLVSFLETQYIQSTYDPRITEITKQLSLSFTQTDLSIDRILNNQGNNSDYLRRLFKRVHGCTPIQYLNRLRIGKAKLLIEGNSIHHYTITEIAEKSGFSDVSYFSRVFREHMGFSPSQYERLFPGTGPKEW